MLHNRKLHLYSWNVSRSTEQGGYCCILFPQITSFSFQIEISLNIYPYIMYMCTSVTRDQVLGMRQVITIAITDSIRQLVVLTIRLWVVDVLPAVSTCLNTHRESTQTTCDKDSLLSHTLAAPVRCYSHDQCHSDRDNVSVKYYLICFVCIYSTHYVTETVVVRRPLRL